MRQKYLLIIGILFLWSENNLGQESVLNDTFSIQVNEGELTDALQVISDKTGVRFAYRNKILLDKKVVSECFSSTFLRSILEKVIVKNNLCYTWQGNQVIIHTACLPKYYTVTGTILEDSTFLPLPYVSVSLPDKPAGVIADANGRFELDLIYSSQSVDTLIFSSLGFKRDTIIVQSKESEITVIMAPKTYKVPEVTIRPIIYEKKKVGNTKDRQSGSLYLDTHGQQAALFIENTEKRKGIVESVEYYLSKKGNIQAPLRVRIYDADSTGKPGNDLIEDAVVVKPDIVGGWFTVDISVLSVEIPENGMFISVEGIYPDEFESYFGSEDFIDLAHQDKTNEVPTLMYGQRIGYNRKCRQETWHYSMNKVWFQLEKQSFGVMISATVKYEKDNENEKDNKNGK